MAIKRNEVLIPATWMNLENLTLSERSQAQKEKYCVLPHNVRCLAYAESDTEGRKVVARGWGSGMGSEFYGYRISVWDDDMF